VILALFEPYLEILRKELKMKKKEMGRMRFPSMKVGTTRIGRKKISLVGAPLGSPQAVILLERLIAMGGRRFVSFGCCGSLQADLKVGDWVIPSGALSEEGTSTHYPLSGGNLGKGRKGIRRLLGEQCQQKDCSFRTGEVWTTDALFRETREKVGKYSRMGILAVEMEISALFSVAAYRRVDLGALLVVSDELGTLKWRTGFLDPLFWAASKKAAKRVVEVAASL
jgi:uridine phosphorylase